MSTPYIFSDIEQLNTALAQKIVAELEKQLEVGQQILNIALSGGKTPQGLLAQLLDKHSGSIIWRHLKVYWVDERHVPFDHPESNYGNIRPFLEGLGIPLHQIHPMGSESDTQVAARRYHELIMEIAAQRPAGDALFDFTLLGVGPDGHMASLFPGSDHQHDLDFCKATIQPETQQPRISLTLPALNRSRCCIFMASGETKAEIISIVLRGDPDPRYPASLIKPPDPPLWYLDEAAASLL